jgi:hypothetical protein
MATYGNGHFISETAVQQEKKFRLDPGVVKRPLGLPKCY